MNPSKPSSINGVNLRWRDIIPLLVMMAAIIGSYASLRADVASLSEFIVEVRRDIRQHSEAPGHPVTVTRLDESDKRWNMILAKLDRIEAQLKK